MRNSQLLSIAVGLACFLWMLNFLGITPFFPFIANDLSTTVALLGQITGLVALVSVPIGMITGPLADRYGHRKVLLSGVGALSVGSFITAVAPSYGTLMLLGCVDISPQPDESGGEMKEAKVSGVQLLKPGEYPPIVLYFVDEAFDQMTLPV